MPTPTLGYGQQSEQTIDTVNQWMRASDWYNTLIRSFGQQPNNVHLNDQQKQQVLRAAQAQGVVVDEGNMEIDPSGNFNPIGHKLRNTLIVAGVAAATIATMGAAGVFSGAAGAGAGSGAAAGSAPVLEGVAAGGAGATTVPAAAGAGGLLGSTTTVPLATGTIAGGTGLTAGTGAGAGLAGAGAFDAAGNFIGSSTYDIPADVAGTGGRTYADLLRYGLPVAGNLAGSLITANATSNASAAQQKYLEEALAYEKENDLYNRGVAADKVKLEAARYGDYQGRIGPFIANGTSSNDRMAQLLGLPARPASTSPGGVYSSYGTATPTGVAVSPALTQRILDNYKTLGLTPTGPGSGPTDTAYYAGKYAETGGDTAANNAYWFGPSGRIATDAQKAGIAFTPTPAAPTPSLAARAPIQPKAALVPVRAPDGSVSHVPADQLDYYTQRGGTVLGTAV